MSVRVATYSFVGEPAFGDRPDTKSTPFVLRMVTEDLAQPPRAPLGDDGMGVQQNDGLDSVPMRAG